MFAITRKNTVFACTRAIVDKDNQFWEMEIRLPNRSKIEESPNIVIPEGIHYIFRTPASYEPCGHYYERKDGVEEQYLY